MKIEKLRWTLINVILKLYIKSVFIGDCFKVLLAVILYVKYYIGGLQSVINLSLTRRNLQIIFNPF